MFYKDPEELVHVVKQWKAAGETIVFTNGVFDILHVGHVTYLEAARCLGTKLVVGINDDAGVRALNKGPERPIHPQDARAAVVAALKCVEATVLFAEPTPLALIEKLQPDVLVKGGDYDPNETDPALQTYMVGSDVVKRNGGQVVAIPLVDGFSTTAAVRKLRGH
jgi:D-glycero-beta-D-manno-heptose 1-phosphate adenylyltransferase